MGTHRDSGGLVHHFLKACLCFHVKQEAPAVVGRMSPARLPNNNKTTPHAVGSLLASTTHFVGRIRTKRTPAPPTLVSTAPHRDGAPSPQPQHLLLVHVPSLQDAPPRAPAATTVAGTRVTPAPVPRQELGLAPRGLPRLLLRHLQ
jgi:hypothetical protein